MVTSHVLKAGSKQPFFPRINPNVAPHDTVVQWLMVLLYCNLSCLLAILHCTAFLETAPLNATGCKIKDIIMHCMSGEAVKVHDICFLNSVLLNRN